MIQYNEYYPFGLQTSSSWTRESTTGNRFLYNQGAELNAQTGWYDTPFRGYDPGLGRFMQVDPLASATTNFSPYHYAGNNPVMFSDPSGLLMDKDYIPMSWDPNTGQWIETAEDDGAGGSNSYRPNPASLQGYFYQSTLPGSGNHWSDGMGHFNDWSPNHGSASYTAALNSGAINNAGVLYNKGPDDKLYAVGSNSAGIGYYIAYVYPVAEPGGSLDWTPVVSERFVETAQQGDLSNDNNWGNSLVLVGIIFGAGADGFVGGGVTFSTGGVTIIRGPDAGKVVYFLDRGVGLGLDLSVAVQAGFLFYTGDVKNFTKESIPGDRTAFGAALGMAGLNGFITPADAAGGRVIGLSGTFGPGINPLNLFGILAPWTFNVNYGGTETFKTK